MNNTSIVRTHQKLNTLALNTLPSIIFALNKYKKLIRHKDSTLNTNVFNRIIRLFFRSNITIKYKIVKFLIKNHENFQYADPTLFKSDILNNLLSLDVDSVKCIIKLIKTYRVLLNDDEILCEYLFLKKKKINIQTKDKIIFEICKKTNLKHEIKNLEFITDYVKNNKNKYVVKLIARYPPLMNYAQTFLVRDRKFLNTWEAKQLYKYFRIFVPEWNKKSLLIKERDINNSLVEKYVFLKKYLQYGNIDKALEIIYEIVNLENLRPDYKAMFQYLCKTILNEKCSDILIEIYGIKKNKEFKEMSKYIKFYNKKRIKFVNDSRE